MRASGWGGRLALLVFGFLVAALLLEVWLQTLAWWIGSAEFRPRGRAHFEGDGHRVLCIGDSNTYGYEVAAEEAYPAQLERLWNQRGRRPRIEVVNLGYPGTNSSTAAAKLPGLLDAFAPDTILVMIGVNDFWTQAEPVAGVALPAGADYARPTRLRIGRLFAVLRTRLSDPTDAEQFIEGMRGAEFGSARLLPRHLEVILATARARGVTPVLLTYPSSLEPYPIANGRIRAAGAKRGVRVVDLARIFQKRCPGEVCDLLQPDGHPTAAGHRVVAETLVAQRVVRRRP